MLLLLLALQQAPSVRELLAIPLATPSVPSPDGRAFAWIGTESGRRSIWIAEAPAYRARRLTEGTGDDGQQLTSLAWTRDSRALLYVRGGASGNWDATLPANPTSDPAGTDQSIWMVERTGGAPRRVADGHSPAPSPAGNRLAFLRRDTIFVGPLRGPGSFRALRLRGSSGSHQWSPDGSRLAFVSTRNDHSFVGVLDVARDDVTWIAPGSWTDYQPRWSADGTRIAFIRQTGDAFAEGAPLPPLRDSSLGSFRIMTAELATPADARVAYVSRPGPNAGLRTIEGFTLQWGNGDTLLFGAEASGWPGVYRTTAAGGQAVRLTPDGCEVRYPRLDPSRGQVYYSSNCGDIDRLHVQRVAVAGGAPVAVTSGAGIEWGVAVLADGRVVVMRSDARRPMAPAFADDLQPLAGWPEPGVDVAALVEPTQVVVRAADSLEIHLQVFEPRHPCPRAPVPACPAVIFFHGGPQRQMFLGWNDGGYYHNAYGFNQWLASRGYVVVSVNYRGGIGYGRAFRAAPRRGPAGASEYLDVLAAAAYLRSRGDVDSARIGLWGGSYGGYLTALGLARNSDLFAAGFDLHGVHDYAVDRQGRRRGNDSAVAIARRSSPVGDLSRWRSPILLVVGDDDRNVEFQQTTDLALRLRRLGLPVEEIVLPDEIHGFLRYASWVTAYEAGAEFFERHLKRRVAVR